MRIFRAATFVLIVLTGAAAAGCGSGGLFRPYEYEEDVYLSLDGSATVYVNASIPALDVLRGAPFDADPRARLDRDAVRRFYTTPVTRVTAINESRRSGRRHPATTIAVDDIRKLGDACPAWSPTISIWTTNKPSTASRLARWPDNGPSMQDGTAAKSSRSGFICRAASRMHNAGANNMKRATSWCGSSPFPIAFAGRLVLDAMRTESILYSALTLFGFTCVAVAGASSRSSSWRLDEVVPEVQVVQGFKWFKCARVANL
jgi:hypothetical protein